MNQPDFSPPAEQRILQANDVRKSFGNTHVLNGVDLIVPRGAIVGLLGTNGAGKSTLLKCMVGLLRLSSGHATMFGEDVWDLSAESKSRLGYVPQVVKFYPWMNVGQMIEYTAAFYENWDHAYVNRMRGVFDLDLRKKVRALSTGEGQRLGILLGMGHRPELLILDEPAASLDPAGRRALLRTLLAESEDLNRTVLFSTHITSDLERVASHVAILRYGVVEYFGELDQLKDSVKRVRISSTETLPSSFSVPKALRTEVSGHSAVAAVADYDEHSIAALEEKWNATVAVEDLNLEDIFLEIHDA